MKKRERKLEKRWCSKHQVVHIELTKYWSCRFPNAPEMNNKEYTCLQDWLVGGKG